MKNPSLIYGDFLTFKETLKAAQDMGWTLDDLEAGAKSRWGKNIRDLDTEQLWEYRQEVFARRAAQVPLPVVDATPDDERTQTEKEWDEHVLRH